MPRSQLPSSIHLGLLIALLMPMASCSLQTSSPSETGAIAVDLEIDGVAIDSVTWVITADGMEPMSGTIDTSALGSTASVEVFGLPPGDYLVTLSAIGVDGQTECEGSEGFSIQVDEVTRVMVVLRCKVPDRFGAVRVNGKLNVCAELTKVVVSPLQTWVGDSIDLKAVAEDVEGDSIAYAWQATGGTIADPSAQETSYTCEEVGEHMVTVTVTDDEEYCDDGWTVKVECGVASCPCYTVDDVGAIANDSSCDPICVLARPTGLNLTAVQCSVTRPDYSALVEELTDFGGESLCQLNLPDQESVVIVGLAESELRACQSNVLAAAAASGLECL